MARGVLIIGSYLPDASRSPERVRIVKSHLKHPVCDLRVDLRGGNAAVTQQTLDEPCVHAGVQQVSRCRVAEHVWRHASLDPGGDGDRSQSTSNELCGDALFTVTRKQIGVVRRHPTSIEKTLQGLQCQTARQINSSLSVTFAMHKDRGVSH